MLGNSSNNTTVRFFISTLKRYALIIAGSLSLIIGLIGIIVPILPTTPFLLLAAFCYLRGSRRLYHSLLKSRILGSYIRNYLEGRGMTFIMKVWTLSLLWTTILFSILFFTENPAVRIVLGIVLIGVTIHILCIKTIRKKQRQKNNSIESGIRLIVLLSFIPQAAVFYSAVLAV